MTFTCIRCLADTNNDCDICDDCLAESREREVDETPPVTNGEG